ncbi:MAG: rRNA maturation RNase YbeY [Armatimonadota bacterium]|nr:rRNA maturation RNase YbeY [Armatimonadota bacterium]MDR7533319.1 rRNA maturation RNase YbeY [Armatimonadota bacterium]MDR7536562.1 rRNA maturation RNase YbeY [Armatimonadota bacterium]
MRVHLVTHRVRSGVPRQVVAAAARAALRATRAPAATEVEVALVDDATIARLNRRYLGHRGPTDVLTFPGDSSPVLGEIVVSVERARAQAAALGHGLWREVALLVIHGVLHLRGYDDRTHAGAARMHRRAHAILATLRRTGAARMRPPRGRR